MKVKLGNDVRIRKEPGFGGIIYVPHRDDFFAVNFEVYGFIDKLSKENIIVPEEYKNTYKELAKLGVCNTEDPITSEISYSGPSFLGVIPEVPSVAKPLVVNCFSTAFCPLACIYCHADDLMKEYRKIEKGINSDQWKYDIKNVITTATMVPAMVAVITGGEPLFKPERTIQLIEGLSNHKSLVLDTSGFGFIDPLLPTLIENNVHVRVSLDSIRKKDNDSWRRLNEEFLSSSDNASPLYNALRTIRKCQEANLSLSVQTVISAKNDSIDFLPDFRDKLIDLGVKNWVIHILVRGGKARVIEKKSETQYRGGIVPRNSVRKDLGNLIEDTINKECNIDIRCTDNDSTPNSVLLINSEGDLFTEGLAHKGKVKLYDVKTQQPDQFRAMWSFIDWSGHSRRYLNWNEWSFGNKDLKMICYQIPHPEEAINNFPKKGLTKTEIKYKISDLTGLLLILENEKYVKTSKVRQCDEYYDTKKGNLVMFDYILRVRKEDNTNEQSVCKIISFIGPKYYAETGEYSQFELNFPISDEDAIYDELLQMNLEKIWYFEKIRSQFRKDTSSLIITVDEIPEIGFYIELSGNSDEVEDLVLRIKSMINKVEIRNYREIFIDSKQSKGIEVRGNKGPMFSSTSKIKNLL